MSSSQRVTQGRGENNRPLLLIASDRVGMRRAFKVLGFMASWDFARSALRRESLTLEEYAEYWREARPTAFRHQALFREAFPGEKTPDRLLDVAASQWDARTGVQGLGQVTFA